MPKSVNLWKAMSKTRKVLLLSAIGAVVAAAALIFTSHAWRSGLALGGTTPRASKSPAPGEIEPALPAPGTEIEKREGTSPSRTQSGIRIPSQYALFPGTVVPAAESWDELLRLLSPDERKIAQQLAALYPEAYAFTSLDQLEWMINNGYPMPQELAIASSMSLGDLNALASSGNLKAAMLANHRILHDAIAAADGRPINDRQEMAQFYTNEAIGRTRNCSPFGMYQRSRYFETLAQSPGTDQNEALQQALAAYAMISMQGDWRVDGTAAVISSQASIAPYALAHSVLILRNRLPASCKPVKMSRR